MTGAPLSLVAHEQARSETPNRTLGEQRGFVAHVAHELRTPLTSLRAALDLIDILPEGDADHAKVMLAVARRNADRLAVLLDDILDVEKAQHGGLLLVRRPVVLHDLVEAATTSVRGTAAARGVDLHAEAGPGVVWGDAHRLTQAVGNLLSNAVRHSEAGTTVSLRAVQDDSTVAITTDDQGCGISPEAVPHLFDPYWQAVPAAGTSGLGLAIVRTVAEAHGGSVHVDSELGAGSRFTVSLPRRARSLAVPFERRRSAS